MPLPRIFLVTFGPVPALFLVEHLHLLKTIASEDIPYLHNEIEAFLREFCPFLFQLFNLFLARFLIHVPVFKKIVEFKLLPLHPASEVDEIPPALAAGLSLSNASESAAQASFRDRQLNRYGEVRRT